MLQDPFTIAETEGEESELNESSVNESGTLTLRDEQSFRKDDQSFRYGGESKYSR